MVALHPEHLDLEQTAARIGAEIAGTFASDVDREARFPAEALEAIRAEAMLSALVPEQLGGSGAALRDVGASTTALSRHCASTGMIYAMHQVAVACIARHASTEFFRSFLREIADRQLLLASATTEIGVGGDTGSSICAVEQADGRFRLDKKAPVISYGLEADAILVTARRSPESAGNDQVLVLCARPGLYLEQSSEWDGFGMRGTCSSGYRLVSEGSSEAIVPTPFSEILAETMQPASHILWGHVWLGIAAEATARARRFVQAEMRKKAGSASTNALRLAELMATYQQMATMVRGAASEFDKARATATLSGGIALNGLKVSASTMVVDIVQRALGICGMAGYRESSEYAMGRLLRDAHSAAVMINNDRILANNAQLLMADRSPL